MDFVLVKSNFGYGIVDKNEKSMLIISDEELENKIMDKFSFDDNNLCIDNIIYLNRRVIMRVIKEDEGIELLENQGKYYLQYDAGTHMIKKKRIEILKEEANICQYDEEEMYNLILQYQNIGVYGEDV